MSKLTSNLKKQITRDWLACLPELGDYQPMWLMKRLGCLLVGVHLERDSSNAAYRPTFHTHVLGKGFPVVSLTLAHRVVSRARATPEAITASSHKDRFREACERLKEQSPLPLHGLVRWSGVRTAYEKQIAVSRFPVELYEDLIVIAAWWAPSGIAEAYLESVLAELSLWPAAIFAEMGGFQAWVDKLQKFVADRLCLESAVMGEIDRCRLENVPEFSLEWDTT